MSNLPLYDRDIARLCFVLEDYYTQLKTTYRCLRPSSTEAYKKLLGAAKDKIQYDCLNQDAQNTLYSLVNAFYMAKPVDEDFGPRPSFNELIHIQKLTLNIRIEHNYSRSNSLSDWLLFDALLIRPLPYHNAAMTHSSQKEAKNTLICLILLSLLIGAGFASYYLVGEMADQIQRLYFNEGRAQAVITLFGTLTGGATMAAIASVLIAMLAPSLPVLATCAVLSGLIGAAIGCKLSHVAQDKFAIRTQEDALIPEDPERYALSNKQERHLIEKGLDPLKVKMAIVFLRKEIGPMPSATERFFRSKGQKARDALEKIRALRHGHVEPEAKITIGDMQMDCRLDNDCEAPHATIASNDNPVMGEVIGI